MYKVARELTHVSADIIRMFFHDILIEAIGRPCNVTGTQAVAFIFRDLKDLNRIYDGNRNADVLLNKIIV